MSSAHCRAKRYAVKYDPPTIILEYETPAKEKRLRSVKVQDVQTDTNVDSLTQKVIRSFPRKLDRKSVNVTQVRRLVARLVEALYGEGKGAAAQTSTGKAQPEVGSSLSPRKTSVASKPVAKTASDSFGMSVDSIHDADTDLNKLSDEELQAIKASMDVGFSQNRLTPDDPGFQYDVQKDFEPTEDNDWDEEDEYEPSEDGSAEFDRGT